jgi:hypothetical protein
MEMREKINAHRILIGSPERYRSLGKLFEDGRIILHGVEPLLCNGRQISSYTRTVSG